MATTYTFRCTKHGDFQLEQEMAATTRTSRCAECGLDSPKVLGGRLQFTYGRSQFHDGPEGTGETVNETGKRWRSEYKQRTGHEPYAAGSRWV